MLSTALPTANPTAADAQRAAAGQSLQTEVRSVGRHSLVYLLGPALSNLVGFVLIPLYTYYIDRSNYGIMSLVDVAMTMAMLILSLGASDGLARFYYAETDDSQRRCLVSSAIVGPALLSLPVIVLAVLLADTLRQLLGIDAQYVAYLRCALLAAWFSMIAEIGNAYLRMRYMAKTFVAIVTLQILAAVSLNLLFVAVFRWGIWGILYSTLIVQGTVAIVLSSVILAQTHAWPRWSSLSQLLAFGLHLVPATVALQLSNYLNPLMLRWLLVGDPVSVLAQVGLFAAGQKLGTVVNRFVTVPFNAFWRPRRMELVVQDNHDVRHILARMCTYATLATCQVALLLSVAAEDLLRLIVAPDYWDAYRVVPLIAAAYVVLGLEHHFVTGMHYARRTQWASLIGAVALIVLIVGNLMLVPRYGPLAAAASTLVSVTIRSGLFWYVSQRLYPIPFELGRLVGMGLVSLALYLVAASFRTGVLELNLVLRLACGGCLVPVLYLLRFFTRAELAGVRSLARQTG
jgi:O-antigen/teichoic acid export membrane protein